LDLLAHVWLHGDRELIGEIGDCQHKVRGLRNGVGLCRGAARGL
jgi:hypothetical protein